MKSQIIKTEEYTIKEQPYYEKISNEIEIFKSSYENKLPVLLKGPTGCGKTRFMEYIAWYLKRPLITVSCHDDLTTADLIGRYLIKGGETVWVDGPLTRAVRHGCICYLDEIVEARKDTTVVIHPLSDNRRILPIEKLGEIITASDNFCLTLSYNPGYQNILKDLKQSTKQRFVAIEFNYPDQEIETKIVAQESGVSVNIAEKLVKLAHMTRNLKGNGVDEGASTRLLIHAAFLIKSGIHPLVSCRNAISHALTDDEDVFIAINELCASLF